MHRIYDPDKANLLRLKVNKINLVQSLKMNEDFLSNLMKLRIIYFKEATDIMEFTTREERAKALIECLLSKSHSRKDWYTQFRNVLLERNYKDLVVFLDNTIIEKPKFVTKMTNQASANFSMYTDSIITLSENNFDLNNPRDCFSIYRSFNHSVKNVNIFELDDKSLNVLIQNIQTYSDPPYGIINELEYSSDQDDVRQLMCENQSYLSFKKLELLYSIFVADRDSFKEMFFLDNFIVFNVLSSASPHIHMKYYRYLLIRYNIDLLDFFTYCFIDKLDQKNEYIKLKNYSSLNDLVFKLANELVRNEKYENANECLKDYLIYLEKIEDFLRKKAKKYEIENSSEINLDLKTILVSKFHTLTNLLLVNNYLLDYKEFQINLNKAASIKHILDESNFLTFSIRSFEIKLIEKLENLYRKSFHKVLWILNLYQKQEGYIFEKYKFYF